MKGVMFTEFTEMVEHVFSMAMLDQIIDDSNLASGGIYTTVGDYPNTEFMALTLNLSKRTGKTPQELLKIFGKHLYSRFPVLFPDFLQDVHSSRDFIKKIDDHIRIEVFKLYPNSPLLPRVECHMPNDHTLVVTYNSKRRLGDIIDGLIQGCVEHFQDCNHMAREDSEDRTISRFILTYAKDSHSR